MNPSLARVITGIPRYLRAFALVGVLPATLSVSLALAAPAAPTVPPPPASAAAPVAAPATAGAVVKAAATLMEADRADEALHTLQAGLNAFPANLELLRAIGAVQRRKGDQSGACATYEAILKAAPDDTQSALILALLLQQAAAQAAPTEAARLLQRAAVLSDYDVEITSAYALAAFQAKQPEAVLAAYGHLPPNRQRRLDLTTAAAACSRELERFADAARLYEALLAATPNDATVAEALVEVLLKRKPAEVAVELDQQVNLHPACVPLLRAQAQACVERGNIWRALDAWARLLAVNPKDADAASRRATALAEVGCATLAEDSLQALGPAIDQKVRDAVSKRASESRREWSRIDRGAGIAGGPKGLVTIAYGDVTEEVRPGARSVDVSSLIRQLEYLRGHGFHFVSTRDLGAVMRGKAIFADRVALLLFQGGYASFAERVLPVLEQYRYPVLLAIPTAAIEGAEPSPATLGPARLSWAQIQALAARPLVTLASETHDLGRYVPCNPQGRLAPAATSRQYLQAQSRYETADEYTGRIATDLHTSQQLLEARTGHLTDILVWPEGAYNGLTLASARELDFGMMFATLHAHGSPQPELHATLTPTGTTTLPDFVKAVWHWGQPPAVTATVTKGMPLDLGTVVGATPEETRTNLMAAVERAVQAGVDTVYLGACADDDRDGAYEATYFANRELPVKADILDYAASLLRYRGIAVQVVMPVLAFRPPGVEPDPRLFVMEYRWGRVHPSDAWERRLSPFHPDARQLITGLYEDLAAYVDFDGLLCGSDAFLTDTEDASTLAAEANLAQTGIHERNPAALTPAQRQQWTKLKIDTLETFIGSLRQTVEPMRPEALWCRSVFGPVPVTLEARTQFGQDFARILPSVDQVVVDTTPETYGAGDADAWVKALVTAIQARPGAMAKTVFSLGLVSGEDDAWISRRAWARRARELVEGGALHLTYEPDLGNVVDRPRHADIAYVNNAVDAARRRQARQ